MKRVSLSIIGLCILCACAGEQNRTLRIPAPNLGIQNPDLIADDDTLKVLLISEIQDDGSETYSVEAYLKDERSTGSKWSEERALTDRFILHLGTLNIQLELNGSLFTKISDVSIPSGAAFQSLHQLPVDLSRIINPSQSIITEMLVPQESSQILSPTALGNYPLNFEPLENRVLSNCAPIGGNFGRDSIEWLSFSNQKISINYFEGDAGSAFSQPLRSFSTIDNGSWQLSPDVFNAYFSPEEISELETPQGEIFAVGYKTALQSVTRSSPLYVVKLDTIPSQILKISIQTIEIARYTIEYEGGCQ